MLTAALWIMVLAVHLQVAQVLNQAHPTIVMRLDVWGATEQDIVDVVVAQAW